MFSVAWSEEDGGCLDSGIVAEVVMKPIWPIDRKERRSSARFAEYYAGNRSTSQGDGAISQELGGLSWTVVGVYGQEFGLFIAGVTLPS